MVFGWRIKVYMKKGWGECAVEGEGILLSHGRWPTMTHNWFGIRQFEKIWDIVPSSAI
jgi:hypothetical protein